MNDSPKFRILIIDDEPLFFEIIKVALQGYNYQILYEQKGELAIDTALRERPDLVILDWEIPVVNGIEVVKQLASFEETKETPVIMCTGRMTTSENLQMALEAGAVDYIRKPLDFVELKARVHSSLLLAQSFKDNKKQLEIIHQQEKEILQNENEKLNYELEANKKDLSTQILKLTHANEVNINMVNDLLEIAEKPDQNMSKSILHVIAKYKELINETTWSEFQIRFEKVYSNFYKNLLEQHPDMTPNELKYCAFFKQGLSSKEISLLSFTNYETIRKSRHRLRKKLKLQSEDDLITYIQKF